MSVCVCCIAGVKAHYQPYVVHVTVHGACNRVNTQLWQCIYSKKMTQLSPVQVPIVVPCFVQACCNGNTIFVYVHISTYVRMYREGFPISCRAREGWGCPKWVKLFVIQQLLATAGASGHNKLKSCPLKSHNWGLQSFLWSPFTHCVVNGRTQWQPPLLEPQLAAPQAYHHWRK